MIGGSRTYNLALGLLVSLAVHVPIATVVLRDYQQDNLSTTPAIEQRLPPGSSLELGSRGAADDEHVPLDSSPVVGRAVAQPHAASSGFGLARVAIDTSHRIKGAAGGIGSPAAVAHLWQSTLFAVLAGLLALALQDNRARVRYWIWLGASIKFLVPFALLVNAGAHLQWPATAQRIAGRAFAIPIARFSQAVPIAAPLQPTPGVADAIDWRGLTIVGLWACGALTIMVIRLQMWRRIRAAVTAGAPIALTDSELPPGVQVLATSGLLEPGVVGFWRPILLLPAGIDRQLTPAQLQAVVAHECAHIRFHDNLTAAIHMIAEAMFWFHPLVWWIGARLVAERERACDEDVLRRFGDPRSYAEGILTVCRRYVDSRLACVAGVSGSDLRKRIEAIMSNPNPRRLSVQRTSLLAAAGLATIGIPMTIGMLGAPIIHAQSLIAAPDGPGFETASVKPNKSGDPGWRLEPQPGGRLAGTNVSVAALVRFAYDRPEFQVFGGPGWLDNDRFDVGAKAEGDPSVAQKRLMLRKLLADRFRLVVHTETRDLPTYAIVMARSDGRLGPRLHRSEADCGRIDQPSQDSGVGPSPSGGPARCGFFGFAPGTDMPSGRGGLAFRGLTMAALAKTLMQMVGRSVSDQTGLAGYFDADFDFMSELPPPPPPPGIPNPWTTPFVSVFTVLPEQLGLKLDARRGLVEVLVIDGAEPPTPD